jgi:hypothetical protein
MQTIDLAYVGRGVHEELVAHVADQEGYYAGEGIHVAVHDGVGKRSACVAAQRLV